jgi:uridine phosphorylase
MPDEEITKDDEQVEEQEQKPEPKPSRPENRFKDLSEKVELTAKERDEAKAAAEAATKEMEFYKGFSKLKYPEAADFQEKIKEKVLAGYDMEDAAISVLAKAGKLNAPQATRQSPAGGSASTAVKSGDEKPVNEMTRAEKREALLELERTDPGSLSQTLRNLNLS